MYIHTSWASIIDCSGKRVDRVHFTWEGAKSCMDVRPNSPLLSQKTGLDMRPYHIAQKLAYHTLYLVVGLYTYEKHLI